MPLYIQYTFTCTRLEHVRSIRYGSVPRIPKDYARLFPFLELWVFCSFYVVCFRNPVYSSERAAIELWLRIHTPRNNKELTKESKFYRLIWTVIIVCSLVVAIVSRRGVERNGHDRVVGSRARRNARTRDDCYANDSQPEASCPIQLYLVMWKCR